MYGYTPPLVIAVADDLVGDVAGLQRVAAGLADRLARRPAWVALHAPARLVERCRGAQLDLPALVDELEALDSRPGRPLLDLDASVDTPRTWLERAVAELLRYHALDQGLDLPVVELSAEIPLPRRASAILCAGVLRQEAGNYQLLEAHGSVLAAVTAARELGSTEVEVWGGQDQVDGVARGLAARFGITLSQGAPPDAEVRVTSGSTSRKADA